MADNHLSRRQGLGLAALAAGAAAAPALAAAPKISFKTKVDFDDPEWCRDTTARMQSDVDPTKQNLGWLKGKAFGVRDNEAVRPLFEVEGFSLVRTRRLPDGSWRRLLRETVFYRDLETGKILKTWMNPYTGEEVRVVPIANNPYNSTVRAVDQKGQPRRDNWTVGPNGTLIQYIDVNLFYPNALTPDKWPRESGGRFNRVSEMFTYTVNRKDVENPNLTNVPVVGAWSRITPWLPWMLMGTAPGHISYFTSFATLPGGLKDLPQDMVEAARALDPAMLSAPDADDMPNESSLEAYVKEQTPAPVPAGWTPPQPPAAPTFAVKPEDIGVQRWKPPTP